MPKCGAWADCAGIAPESSQLVELVLILFGLLMDATQPNKPPMDTKRSGFGVRAAWWLLSSSVAVAKHPADVHDERIAHHITVFVLTGGCGCPLSVAFWAS